MSLDLSKLEKVRTKRGRTIARCPACALGGGDRKGVHLSILPDGRFTCVANQGASGAAHRREIFVLVGIKDGQAPPAVGVRVARPGRPGPIFRTGRTGNSNPCASRVDKEEPLVRKRCTREGTKHASGASAPAPQAHDLLTGFPIIAGAICPF